MKPGVSEDRRARLRPARPVPSRAGTVAARVAARLIEIGVAAGGRRGVLMGAAGITDADLLDPDARLPLVTEIALWQALARSVADTGFGIRAAATSRIRDLGLPGYVACFSTTLRVALRRMQRYSRLVTEAVEFEFREGDPSIALAVCHPALGRGGSLAQEYRLAAVLQAGRELTGIPIAPTHVSFTYEQPASISAHREHFRSPLIFGAPTATIVFRESDLDLPIIRADETLAGYLSKYAEQVLASLVRGETMRHTVHAAIWSLLADGKPPLEQVAAVLRIPSRTLQRRLAAEGTSLQQEIEEIRKTMAIATLREHAGSVEEIAFLLGYAEPSTFYRAFRRWTGTTPQRFRRAAQIATPATQAAPNTDTRMA